MSQPTPPAPLQSVEDDLDDHDSQDLDVGDPIFPLGQSDDPNDATHEIELGDWGAELNAVIGDDDGEGPVGDRDTDSFGLESEFCDDAADDEPSQAEISLLGEQLPQTESTDQDIDELPDDPDLRFGAGASDAEIRWSPQPWCERRMLRAFAPCVAFASRGDLILTTGDSTDVLETEMFRIVSEAPRLGRTSSAVLLDDQAEQALVSTTTGRLFLWNRRTNSVQVQCTDDGRELDCVARVCESAPRSTEIWALLSNGNVFFRTTGTERFTQYRSGEGYLTITPGESGLVAITRDRHLVHLSAQSETPVKRMPLPESNDVGALATRTVFVASRALVLLGSREFGAWLSADGGESFYEIAGCQNMTAATFGTYAGRSYLWIALFCELDDRTELIAVDCKSRRAHKLTSFAVVADCAGPEDDPPERARIDGLHWDHVHQRLWAAGCFGITCFEPPQTTQTKS